MKRRHLWLGLVGLTSCLTVVACGRSGVTGFGDLFDSGGNGDSNDNIASDDTSVGDVTDGNNSNDNSNVGDITTDPDAGTPNPTWPHPDEAIRARVRNESTLRANVTLWFIRDDVIAQSAFLHVRSGMITTVESRRSADTVEASGFDETGDVLDSAEFVFGVDFDETTPAEYTIPADIPDEPIPDDVQPPTIKMLEPESDETLTLGSTLIVRWTYTTASQETVVRIYMQRADAAGTEDRTQVGPTVAAALDGTAGELSIILQDIDPGLYRIVGEIDDGTEAITAVAPGWVEVVSDVDNAAPSITILDPLEEIELYEGEVLPIVWRVEGDDDNATVTFSLVNAEETGGTEEPIVIGQPPGDDSDGDGEYQAELTITGVRPGLYDLVGRIDAGELSAEDRVAGVVRILNDKPELTFLKPADDFELGPGEPFNVVWTDSDDNDNARILLLLDPDLNGIGLDGDEVLLVPPLDEDPDNTGATDTLTVEIPTGVEKGEYRLAGTISDGIAGPVYARAPGLIYFGVCMPQDPELVLTVDGAPLKRRLGETIEVELETSDVPIDAGVRFYLSKVGSGGTVSAEMHTASVNLNDINVLAISSFEPVIPNEGWPRQFDLVVEAEVCGTLYSTAAPDSVWIRQEVEVTNVEVVSYACPGKRDQQCPGLEVEWYGGGFEELGPRENVQFWLSNDGSVPPDGVQDDTHRIIHRASESPNMQQVEQITLPSVIIHVLEGGDQLGCPRGLGHYKLVTVVESADFGRIISPHPDWIGLCLQFLDAPPRE
ncbi:MAG: hypothetical protein JSU86_18685 [Phycisphaerales bacterium]|nr:MAG: hypothetical protein JSU86_18685 [Phycisphaerales bacterium]